MTMPTFVEATLTVDNFRAREGGCLAYLVADRASGTAWAGQSPSTAGTR